MGEGPTKDMLQQLNLRLRNSLTEHLNQQRSKKVIKEEQTRYMQECKAKGLPFAHSLCVLFSGLKPGLDAEGVQQVLDRMTVDRGRKRIKVQSVQLVSTADEKNRRNRGRDGKFVQPPVTGPETKEYTGKAYVVFKDFDNVEGLKSFSDTLRMLHAEEWQRLKLGRDEFCVQLPLAADGKYVRFKEVRRNGHRLYHEDAHGLKVKAVKLQVGNRLAVDQLSVWFETGTFDKPVEVEVSRLHRQLKLKFQYGTEKQERARYCISVKFSTLKGSMLAFKDDNQAGKDRLCLMFTLQHPPHIFKKALYEQSTSQDVLRAGTTLKNDFFQWAWPVSSDNEGWERTVDFTKDLNALGSVFTYRLVLMDDKNVKDVLEELNRFQLLEFTHGKHYVLPLFLHVDRMRYSQRAELVNQYSAALDRFQDYFEVSWRLRSLLHKGKVFHEQLLTEAVVALLLAHLQAERSANVVAALEELLTRHAPVTDVFDALDTHPLLRMQEAPAPSSSKPSYCVQVPRLVITPTRICCSLGDCELSNRVLRKYSKVSDRFLRVSIADEAGDRLYLNEDVSKELKTRIYKFLREGIHVANRHYKFLAFSNSQVRENACWMFAEVAPSSTAGKRSKRYTCAKIREWMGDFSGEKVVAKYAARMGQCFSSSIRACPIGDALEMIPDKEVTIYEDGVPITYAFSDGVGRISVEVAYEVTRMLRELRLYNGIMQPCAFQVRLCGCKGMLVTWSDIEGRDGMVGVGRTIQVRPSMRKFESSHEDLEVVGWSRWMPGHLNQQVIVLLEDRGVGASTFLALQAEYMAKLTGMLLHREAALSFLVEWGWDERSSCLAVVKDALMCGFGVQEPFVHACMQALQAYVVKDLRRKARIQVNKSAMLYGVMDELGILEYGEVYIRIQKPHEQESTLITGDVIVTKSPCLHPGDVRRLKARDVPQFQRLNLTNVVVFPQKGKRPHPSEASGSDLDGDIYFCCWEERITRHVTMHPPFHYAPPNSLTKTKVEIKDVVRFFFEMMSNDALGRVDRAWLAFADREPNGPSSKKCLQLAAKHHQAVDFPKTGAIVELARDELPFEYPHFMDNKTKPSYTSTKVLGLLYDEASRANRGTGDGSRGEEVRVDPALVLAHVDPKLWEGCVRVGERLKLEYENELIKLMNRFEVFSEAELLCGCMVKVAKHRKRSRWANDVREQVLQQVQALWIHFHKKFDELTRAPTETVSVEVHKLVMASAWYCCTYHRATEVHGITLLSFPWIVHHELCRLKLKDGADGR